MRSGLTHEVFKQPISYRFDLWQPPGGEVGGSLLVCLHGYGQSKEASLHFGRSVLHGGPVAALQAPHPHHVRTADGRGGGFSAGFSWVSSYEPEEDILNHHRFILHVINRAHEVGWVAHPRAFLFGFSQSVSLNYRFAATYPESVQGVIAVAGAVPSSWRDNPERLDVPVLHVAPTEDEAYPRERAQGFRKLLVASTDDLTWLEPPGAHRVPRSAYPIVGAWLRVRAQAALTV